MSCFVILQFEVAVGSLPDPNWPVAKQLDHAVETIKKNVKLIMDAKAEAQVAKKVSNRRLISRYGVSPGEVACVYCT